MNKEKREKIQYRRLGGTDLSIFLLSFAGILIAKLSNVQAVRVFMRALDLGINFTETGRAYGDREQKIGFVMSKKREKRYPVLLQVILESPHCEERSEGIIPHLNTANSGMAPLSLP
ncbi:MAG TPA: hypothetical protein ENI41_01545 [Deltaproteobacteria bacterium]|nr:hypothetical protein [Deltaproteobacteria bacterium]